MDWRERGEGACTQHDPELWFAPGGSLDAAIARRICLEDCLVRETCLAYALERRERHGIWGGLTERERRRLAREQRRG